MHRNNNSQNRSNIRFNNVQQNYILLFLHFFQQPMADRAQEIDLREYIDKFHLGQSQSFPITQNLEAEIPPVSEQTFTFNEQKQYKLGNSLPFSESTCAENLFKQEDMADSLYEQFEEQIQKAVIPSNLQILRKLPRKINRQKDIKIECKTEFPLVRNVALYQFGWKQLTRQSHKQSVDVIWTDGYVTQQLCKRLRPYQKINHFPSSVQLGRKDLLFANLNKMQEKFPSEYNFYPKTWNFPLNGQSFSCDDQICFKKKKETNNTLRKKFYIVKPVDGCQGRGIYLTDTLQHLKTSSSRVVVQQYLEKPLLVDRLKFDLRIYVFVKSFHPLAVFIYKEGLARFATKQYQAPSAQNYRSGKMHLTNFSINKLNPVFIPNKDFKKDNVGHKRSLSSIFDEIEKMGGNSVQIKIQIKEIIIKTVLAVYGKMTLLEQGLYSKNTQNRKTPVFNEEISLTSRTKVLDRVNRFSSNKKIQKRRQANSKCFQLLGFDIMIDQSFQPKLIQINHQPSLQTGSPLDYVIKKYLLIDLFCLLDPKAEDKAYYLDLIKNPNRAVIKEYLRKGQNQKIQQNFGGFQRIFPSSNPQRQKVYEKIVPYLRKNTQILNQKKRIKSRSDSGEKNLNRTFINTRRKQFMGTYIGMIPRQTNSYGKDTAEQIENVVCEYLNRQNGLGVKRVHKRLQNVIYPTNFVNLDQIQNMGKKMKQLAIHKKNLNFTIKYKRNKSYSGRNITADSVVSDLNAAKKRNNSLKIYNQTLNCPKTPQVLKGQHLKGTRPFTQSKTKNNIVENSPSASYEFNSHIKDKGAKCQKEEQQSEQGLIRQSFSAKNSTFPLEIPYKKVPIDKMYEKELISRIHKMKSVKQKLEKLKERRIEQQNIQKGIFNQQMAGQSSRNMGQDNSFPTSIEMFKGQGFCKT